MHVAECLVVALDWPPPIGHEWRGASVIENMLRIIAMAAAAIAQRVPSRTLGRMSDALGRPFSVGGRALAALAQPAVLCRQKTSLAALHSAARLTTYTR